MAVLGTTDMILKFKNKFQKEQIIEKVSKLNLNIRNQYNATEKLLDWSRIQSNNFEYRPIKLNLDRILKNIENTFEIYLLEKNINFIINSNNLDLK